MAKTILSGFTLVEILIVIAIMGILATILLVAVSPKAQITKARDARRKGDMSKIQRCLDEYNNDHGFYLPTAQFSCNGTTLAPCMPSIPCDPYFRTTYVYQTDGTATPQWYKLYANLEYTSDPVIGSSGCSLGCVASGSISGGSSSSYNFVVGSANSPPNVAMCAGARAPICSQPQNYVGVCGSCCDPTQARVRQIGNSYYCCPDNTCP